jgi:hypothetical protein
MALKQLAFVGGVDLMTPVAMAQPGTLRDCLNYERGIRRGYTRMDGIQAFDGQYRPGEYQIAEFEMRSFSTDALEAVIGEAVTVESASFQSADGFIIGSTLGDGGVWQYTILFAASSEIPERVSRMNTDAISLVVTDDGFFPYVVVTETDVTAEVFNAAAAAIEAITRANVETVLGEPGSDIIGGFWLKNRCYAIRDLPRLYFNDGLYTDANEGQFVTIGAAEYEILAVTQQGGGSGFLTYHPVAGSGTDATGVGAPASFTLSGNLVNGDVTVAYNSGPLVASGSNVVSEWSIVDDVFAASSQIDANNPSLIAQQTNAALWKADSTGWSMVDMGREMLFSGGTTNLSAFIRDATLDGATVKTTGAAFPTASTINGTPDTGLNSDNGVTTALTGASGDIFVAGGFDFSGIPSSAIIRGITVIIERQSNTANQAVDNTVTLVGITGGAENKARGTAWPNAIGTATYGGSTDLWGNQAITVDDLQDAAFAVMVIADRKVPATATIGGIDYITVNVSYVERDSPAYVWDGTTDQEITIRHVQFLGGETSDSTAYGYITLDAPKNGNKTRIINVGDEIRTTTSGLGDLLAVVAARDMPIWFPGQTEIDNNCSQYKAAVTNFFASDGLDAAYIVCGVGPCTYYDGARAIRIRADLPQQDDNPRHVERHGEKLVLGYFGGALAQSQVQANGGPFEMRASRGALYTPFGDRIMGLRKRVGDELLVPCENSIQFYSGYTSTTGIRQTIAKERGMLEYSDVDPGIPLGCDGQGVFDISTVNTFGPAERTYLSMKVAPWLQPRLQATDNAGQPNIRLRTAVAVRAKNQARWFFEDGYIMTMTAEDPIEFTFQRYTDAANNDSPLAVRAVWTGIDAAGRSRIFASFKNAKEGLVFELDSGRSFDGQPIPAYVVLNPLAPSGSQSTLVREDVVFVYGAGYGVANLTHSRAKDYGEPDPDNNLSLVLGSPDADAALLAGPLRGCVDFPIEGYDVTLRFDSSSASEGPHTLQMTNLYIDDRGPSRGHTGN